MRSSSSHVAKALGNEGKECNSLHTPGEDNGADFLSKDVTARKARRSIDYAMYLGNEVPMK